MERARAEGKNLGRPPRKRPVTEHPSWSKILTALEADHINRAEPAKKLHVRKAVLIAALGSFPKGGPANGNLVRAQERPLRLRSRRKSFWNLRSLSEAP